jgi:hypothetical protein
MQTDTPPVEPVGDPPPNSLRSFADDAFDRACLNHEDARERHLRALDVRRAIAAATARLVRVLRASRRSGDETRDGSSD